MKTLHLFSLLAISLMTFSCTEELVEPNQSLPTPELETHEVSVETALSELNSVLLGIDGSTTRSSPQRQIATISTVKATDIISQTRSGETPNIDKLVYIANFENNEGYAILAANDRLAPVITITEKGNLTQKEFIAAAHNECNDSLVSPILSDVAAYVLSGPGADRPLIPMDSLMYTEYGEWETVKVGPLVPVKWSQGSPYNYYKPESYVSSVAVAYGQLITAELYKPKNRITSLKINGENINWILIYQMISRGNYTCLSFTPESKEVAKLLYNCGLAVHTNFGSIANGTGSGAYSKDVVPILNLLGFKGVNMEVYNQNTIIEKIKLHNNPVYLGVLDAISHAGLAMLIDGVYEHTRTVKKKLQGAVVDSWIEGTTLFHTNFGFDGKSDGYYYPGVFDLRTGPQFQEPKDQQDYRNSRFSTMKEMIYYDSFQHN
ncbi:C10 family peptidase [Bacteroides sp.]